MRQATLLMVWLGVAIPAMAQAQPDLVWEGEISTGATIFVQGNHVDVQGRNTGAVDRPSYRFRQPLRRADQEANVRVERGKGRVVISEQPSAANDYSLVVEIDNRGLEPQYYVLNFSWQSDQGRSRDSRRQAEKRHGNRGRGDKEGTADGTFSAGSVTWSGRVDHEALVTFHQQKSNVTGVQGQTVKGEYARFTSPMPRRDISLRLSDVRGRGKVELLEQPNSRNEYMAKVRILDEESGSSDYTFTLSWIGDNQSAADKIAERGNR